MMSDEDPEAPLDDEGKVRQGRHRCLVLGLVVVGALAIAAIVLPLVLDNCDCPDVPRSNPQPLTTAPVAPAAPVAQPTTSPVAVSPPTPSPVVSPTPVPTPVPTPLPTTAAPTLLASDAPSFGPTTMALQQFIDRFLVDTYPAEVLEDRNSPQFKAAGFLADDFELNSELGTFERLRDIWVLAVFYFAMNGPNWTTCADSTTPCSGGSYWLNPSVDHCDWSYVTCNELQRVSQINFLALGDGNNLEGIIVPEIGSLDNLTGIALRDDNIYGNFPTQMGMLQLLEDVIIFNTQMSGQIPDDIFANSAATLEFVGIANTQMDGNLPAFDGNYPNLRSIILSGNLFDGSIPSSYTALPGLSELRVDNNQLTGDISIITQMPGLERFDVANNAEIGGMIPADIGSLSFLSRFVISGTQISGELPDSLFTLPSLELLDVSGCALTGVLNEKDFSSLSASLRDVYLSNNMFSGDVGATFDNLFVLNELRIQGNDLTGEISSVLCSRRGMGRNQIQILEVDCDEVTCSCCEPACS